jgi:hypothetical protein
MGQIEPPRRQQTSLEHTPASGSALFRTCCVRYRHGRLQNGENAGEAAMVGPRPEPHQA